VRAFGSVARLCVGHPPSLARQGSGSRIFCPRDRCGHAGRPSCGRSAL